MYSQDTNVQENNATDNLENTDSTERINEGDLELNFSEVDNEDESSSNLQAFGIAELIRMVFVLALVVGMIYGVYFFLKRSRKNQEEQSNFISVLTSQTLPGSKVLHIVDVGGRVYLLAASDSNLSLITEIVDKPTIDALRLHSEEQEKNPKSFSGLMSTIFLRNSESPDSVDSDSGIPSGTSFSFIQQKKRSLHKFNA